MILVTTPTGDIGARVLARLLDAGRELRVICRDPGRLAPGVADRVDVVAGSHADRGAIDRALPGAAGVFWLPPGGPTEPNSEAGYVEFSRAFAEALPGSDATHVVGVSALGRGWPKPAGLVSSSLAMDDLIGAAGPSYRALACASLMDNLLRQLEPIRSQGAFRAPTPGDLELPHVAKADVAAVAARLLLSTDWDGVGEVALHGPEDLSFDAMARIASEVLGRPVRFREIPMERFGQMLRGQGASEGMTRDYELMLTAKNEGMDAMIRPAPRTDTPTTFRAWCEAELRPAVAG